MLQRKSHVPQLRLSTAQINKYKKKIFKNFLNKKYKMTWGCTHKVWPSKCFEHPEEFYTVRGRNWDTWKRWNNFRVTPGGVKLTNSTLTHHTVFIVILSQKPTLKWEIKSPKQEKKRAPDSHCWLTVQLNLCMYGIYTCQYLLKWELRGSCPEMVKIRLYWHSKLVFGYAVGENWLDKTSFQNSDLKGTKSASRWSLLLQLLFIN